MPNYHKPESKLVQDLKDMANRLRIHSISSTQAAGSGHPTSCSSIAEIMSVLFFNTMRLKLSAPRDPSSDRFILSKGHAAPILYAAWAEAGLFPVADLQNLRKIDSDLEGHPTPRLNFIDVATGSLGQGLAVGCGMAYVGKHFDKADYRTYVVIGDGEAAEGSVWESLSFAGHYKLDNLCVIFDVNRLGQSDPTCLQHEMTVYQKRLESFGFNAIVVDGHDVEELCKAFYAAETTTQKPTAIIAKTYKGRNFPEVEDLENWHGKPLGNKAEQIIAYLESMIKNKNLSMKPRESPKKTAPEVSIKNITLASPPAYKMGEAVATRLAYGTALAKIAVNNDRVIALDGDTKNSTYSDKLKKAFPDRHIECFIAEQNLVGVTIGAACRDRTVAFASTFATFFTRAFDQIRMGAISMTNANFVGSHCGVSIGEDGPSQMGLEDIAMFRTIPGSTVFYPADAVSCERAVELAANTKGVCFIRTSRPNTAVIYDNNEKFVVGKGKVVKKSDKDQVLLIGAGITLYEALTAAGDLKEQKGINARVFDPFTIKPLDRAAIVQNAKECGGRVVVVEDHYKEGGLGEAVMAALADQRNVVIKHLAVPNIPRSGPPAVLVDMFGIQFKHVIKAVEEIMQL